MLLNERLIIMGFEKGKPIRNLLYAITHPLETANKKPILFLMMVVPAVFFGGVSFGWWDMDVIYKMLPFLNKG